MLMITPRSALLFHSALIKADARQRQVRATAKVKLRKLTRERFDGVLEHVLSIMKGWHTSRFEFEGPCRNGLRSALCGEGWPFRDAEACAEEVVSKALALMGAIRPTYQEGQPEHGDNSLTIRTRCAHSGCERPIPDERMNNGWTKYCSKECNAAATYHRAQVAGERMSRAEWKAKLAAKRMSVCPTCESPFRASTRGQIFCSHTCFTDDRRRVHEATCRNCNKKWRPLKSSSSAFCSIECTSEHYAKNRREVYCKHCSGVFVLRKSEDRVYCSRACYFAERHSRPSPVICEEITS